MRELDNLLGVGVLKSLILSILLREPVLFWGVRFWTGTI